MTITAAAMIAKRGVNTLVLVHRTELLKQWQERLQVFFGVGKGLVGSIGGGKAKATGKIDIAVMQSLARQGEVNPLVENYGHVIVDECHHVGAVSFDAILKRTRAKYVLGLTATPFRRDGQQPIIFMQCGPIRHTAAKPVTAPRDLEVVPRSLYSRIDLPSAVGIQDVFRNLANDQARTLSIAASCDRQAGRGGIRPSRARHPGVSNARIVEGHVAAVRRPAAPRACHQDRRADHRFCGHRPPGTAADVGQAPSRLQGYGVSDQRIIPLRSRR